MDAQEPYWQYRLYRLVGNVIFFLLNPLFLLFLRLYPVDRLGLRQRLGLIAPSCRRKDSEHSPTVWIHAASVGEVAAAEVLIREFAAGDEQPTIVVTTMTMQGLSVARQRLPREICSFLAPLDVSRIVRRILSLVRPDVYVCLETELWPSMLVELRKAGVVTVLANGRMTVRSFRRYRMVRRLMEPLLRSFSGIAVISEDDRNRFVGLGVAPERIQVTGNIKYDFPQEDIPATRQMYRRRLGVDLETVLVCGSTHGGEEKELAEVYRTLTRQVKGGLLMVIAPRHLRRLAEIEKTFTEIGLGYDLFTALAHRQREKDIILVDCLGELASLYSAGDYNFVGGSLVAKGGHNLMEAARWGRPVYFGPHIDDFTDAAHILEETGGGFRVVDGRELAVRIIDHLADEASYLRACSGAVRAVAGQKGAALRQAALIRQFLTERGANNLTA